MYRYYFGNVLMPVAPSSMSISIGSNNQVINLINEGDVNVLKSPSLTEISFDLSIPQVEYPFAVYSNGFKDAKYFFDVFERLKLSNEPFEFLVSRKLGRTRLHSTSMTVSLESYTIKEQAVNGSDVVVSIKLKQYRPYGTKKLKVEVPTKATEAPTVQAQTPPRTNSSNKPTLPTTYVVKKGDTLWAIAKKYYGNGAQYPKIANANKTLVKNPNLIHIGWTLTIPK